MAAVFKFSEFFLGKDIEATRSEVKRLILTGYLAAICIVVAVMYAVFDLVSNVYYALPTYGVLFLMAAVSLLLLRSKKYKAAKISLIVSINLLVFWSALIDPLETGVFLFFIPVGISSFAILDFEDNKTGLILVLFSSVLFILAYYSDIKIIEVTPLTQSYIRITFAVNYFIALAISVLAIYFQMNLNKQSEDELIQKENFASQKNAELQKVNEALDRFVYSVSHDLRSPLSSILGLINLANLTKDLDELNQIIKMIQGRVLAQDNFIREIIDYSRNARTETVSEPIALKKLVEEVIENLKFDGLADKIEFKKEIGDEFILTSDKIRLTVILSNLIGNAIKYHDLNKENPFILVGFDNEQNSLFVEDNGSGVMPQHQQKIFNMFYRGSDRVTGSGLGLFITKEAVSKLGGTIALTSVYGEGSTFVVKFPKETAANNTRSSAHSAVVSQA